MPASRVAPHDASLYQVRFYGFSDACIRWMESEQAIGADLSWLLFHGVRECSEDWLRAFHSSALPGERKRKVHLLDFPGFGGSWTCGGRDWTLHEWAALIKAAIRVVSREDTGRGLALAAHELSAMPLGMALLSEPELQSRVRFLVLLDPWLMRPSRREASRVMVDSWPGPLEHREWSRGLAQMGLPVLVQLTQPKLDAMRMAEEVLRPFPHAEIWFKEGAEARDVLQRVRAFSERLERARAA